CGSSGGAIVRSQNGRVPNEVTAADHHEGPGAEGGAVQQHVRARIRGGPAQPVGRKDQTMIADRDENAIAVGNTAEVFRSSRALTDPIRAVGGNRNSAA